MSDLKFERDSHTYRVGGVQKPSLTEILRSVSVAGADGYRRSLFDYSFVKNPDEIMLRGRWIHDLAALRLTRGPLSEGLVARLQAANPDWFAYYPSFEQWLAMTPDLQPVFIETPMYCKALDFCTTPDLVCYLRKEPTIIEFKTGIATSDAEIQTAGQAFAVAEQLAYEDHAKLHRRFALELRNDGSPAKLIAHKDHVGNRADFLSVMRVFRLLTKGE